MSLLDELTWNKIPPQFDNSTALQLYFKTSYHYCSDRNPDHIAKASYELLKALYYLLPTDDYPVIKTGISDTLNTTIDLSFYSKVTSMEYPAQYQYFDKLNTASLLHACPEHSDKKMCHHIYMTIAISILRLRPECDFSKAFKKLISIYNESGIKNHDFIYQLVTTHDELYYDMLENIIPVNGISLTIHDQLLMHNPDSIPFKIHSSYSFSNESDDLLISQEEFNDNMEQLSDLILSGIL